MSLLSYTLARLRVHPTATNPLVVNFTATAFGLLLFMFLAAARVYFSLGFLTVYIVFTNLWFTVEFLLRRKLGLYTFAVVPGGYDLAGHDFPNCRLLPLESPDALPDNLDGIITDFEQVLPEKWLAFVSSCVLEGVPVVSADDFLETESGVILLEHLNTARTLVFQKGQLYIAVKRLIDTLVVLAASPVWIPVMLLAMLGIRLESPGRALYSQMRVGRRGRPFRIYKIRSMRQDAEMNGAAFASTRRLQDNPPGSRHPEDAHRRVPAVLERAQGRHEHHRPPARTGPLRPGLRGKDPLLPAQAHRAARHHGLGAGHARLRGQRVRDHRKAGRGPLLREAAVLHAGFPHHGQDSLDHDDGLRLPLILG